MSEQLPQDSDNLTSAEKRGGYDAGLEAAPLYMRPGYRKAVKEAVRLGLKSEQDGQRSLSGELHEEITAGSPAPHSEVYTQEQAVAENHRAHREMMGEDETPGEGPVQSELPL